MKVRRALPTDAKAVKSAHYHAYQVSYRGYLPDDYLDSIPFDAAVIERTAHKIENQEYYVAEQNGQVVGFANLDYPEDSTVEIQALYVHPDFQRQGAGSALLDEICHLKKTAGYKKLIIWTIKDGPSLGFYQKKGLRYSHTPEGKMPLYKPWKFNIPIVRLEKDL